MTLSEISKLDIQVVEAIMQLERLPFAVEFVVILEGLRQHLSTMAKDVPTSGGIFDETMKLFSGEHQKALKQLDYLVAVSWGTQIVLSPNGLSFKASWALRHPGQHDLDFSFPTLKSTFEANVHEKKLGEPSSRLSCSSSS